MDESPSAAAVAGLSSALAELSFALEPGGSQHGSAAAYESYQRLSELALEGLAPHELVPHVTDLKLASQELAFSLEPGGANEGDEEVGENLKALEQLVGQAEALVPPPPGEVSFDAQPRERLSDLANG